jgi:hypothetical protein
MTEWIVIPLLISLAVLMFWLNSRVEAQMRIVTKNSPASAVTTDKRLLWQGRELPWEATHIAWIMLGHGDYGTVHTLALQDLASLRADIISADSPLGPIIAKSIELEMDMLGRGCRAASEIMYAIARIDRAGNETWLSRDGDWVARWSSDADVQNIFGDHRTVTL